MSNRIRRDLNRLRRTLAENLDWLEKYAESHTKWRPAIEEIKLTMLAALKKINL